MTLSEPDMRLRRSGDKKTATLWYSGPEKPKKNEDRGVGYGSGGGCSCGDETWLVVKGLQVAGRRLPQVRHSAERAAVSCVSTAKTRGVHSARSRSASDDFLTPRCGWRLLKRALAARSPRIMHLHNGLFREPLESVAELAIPLDTREQSRLFPTKCRCSVGFKSSIKSRSHGNDGSFHAGCDQAALSLLVSFTRSCSNSDFDNRKEDTHAARRAHFTEFCVLQASFTLVLTRLAVPHHRIPYVELKGLTIPDFQLALFGQN